MSTQKQGKLNQLQHLLPEGLLAEAAWLERHGYSRSLRSQYVSANWLEQPARGVFRRPQGLISWEQVVISLQTLMGYGANIGGRSALEVQGYAHYLPQSTHVIHLYCNSKMPSWVAKLALQECFIEHNAAKLWRSIIYRPPLSLSVPTQEGASLPGELRVLHWGHWHWPMVVSTPERAYLELLNELPNKETFHTADVMMEGLANLSPKRMQSLLENTKSVKVKRLFFFFADRHQHQWHCKLKKDKIDMGSGKRMLVQGGRLDPVYQITIPQEYVKDNRRISKRKTIKGKSI